MKDEQGYTLTIGERTLEALRYALREYIHPRQDIRAYVDNRYSTMSDSFRNRKIGEIQDRIDALQQFYDISMQDDSRFFIRRGGDQS